jgi:hypothetical protein
MLFFVRYFSFCKNDRFQRYSHAQMHALLSLLGNFPERFPDKYSFS